MKRLVLGLVLLVISSLYSMPAPDQNSPQGEENESPSSEEGVPAVNENETSPAKSDIFSVIYPLLVVGGIAFYFTYRKFYKRDTRRYHIHIDRGYTMKKAIKGKFITKPVDDYVLIDTETSGLDPYNDEIIELAAVRIKNNEPVADFQSLCRPKKEINGFIQDLTGITNKELKKAPPLKKVLKQFVDFVGDSIIMGHNVERFDINFLIYNCRRELKRQFKNDYVDTLKDGICTT